MNTYYVPMEYDIPHAETTRYERKTVLCPFDADDMFSACRHAQVLPVVAIHSSVHGSLLLFSAYAVAVVE